MSIVLFVAGVAVFAAVYVLPTVVASLRESPNVGLIKIINVFLGWTGIGWVVAMAMALRKVSKEAVAPPIAAP